MELDHWRRLRESLHRQVEMMRDGRVRTFEGPQLQNDTTQISLRLAEQSLTAVERLLARHGEGQSDQGG